MENAKLNILPVPTFGQLRVNYAVRDIKEYETPDKLLELADNSSVSEEITAGGRYDVTLGEGYTAALLQYVRADNGLTLDTKVTAGSGAELKLIQVFDRGAQTVARLETQLADGAELELVQLYIGGSDTVSEIVTSLDGRKSRFDAKIGYALSGSEQLDLNLISSQSGRKTESSITVNGVLRDSSKKVFKGTIDFKNGSSGSKGAEQENVLMLSEDADNRTVPVILCAEEDVEGSHGATIGRIDDAQIFYMQSRGIPEERIYELTARARLAQVIGQIDDEDAQKRIYDSLNWSNKDE